MSVFRRVLVAVVAALAVALSGAAVAPDAAVAAKHHHHKHKHKKKHRKHRPAAVKPRPTPTPTPRPTPTPPPTGGCTAFPADNWWNRDVSALPVATQNAAWLSHMSTSRLLHPDFGGPYGIPVTWVSAAHPLVPVTFDYADESDRVGYPFGTDTRIEGGRDSGGDMHAIVVDRAACRLWETWDTTESAGAWRAGSGATWSLASNALRPDTWTSADAAGLPIYPGLLRYDEVAAGHVTHAIRFTTNVTSRAHLWPARHDAGSSSCTDCPPMGARFRLRAGFDTSSYGVQARTVLAAMKTYGLVLADNGSPWYFQGEQDDRWSDTLLDDLKRVPASAFEAVDTSSLMVSPDSAATR